MANYDLVVTPLIIAMAFLMGAAFYFLWFQKTIQKATLKHKAKTQAMIFGLSLCTLGGFSLFISLFFLITG